MLEYLFDAFVIGFWFVTVPYLMGAIPTGYLFAKYWFGIDITQEGSGNIGATNSARVLGSIKYFFLVFFLDAGKAFVSLLIFKIFCSQGDFILVPPIMLLIGNSYSCFLWGKGGKGVATLVGIVTALAPFQFTVFLLLLWTALFAYFRKVDVVSLLALLISLFIYGIFFYVQHPAFMYFLLFAFIWLIIRHQSNIQAWIFSCSKKSK